MGRPGGGRGPPDTGHAVERRINAEDWARGFRPSPGTLRFISWEAAHPEFMQLVYDRLVASGVTWYAAFDPMHGMDAVCESARMIRAADATESVGA